MKLLSKLTKPGLSHFMRHALERWPALQDLGQWRQGRPFDQLDWGDCHQQLHQKHRAAPSQRRSGCTSICPYCAVGCGQLIYVKDGKVIAIEGNPDSPISGGTLCPKGAATFGFLVNPARVTTVKYRAPYSDHWEERPLDWAIERIAQLVKETRDEGYKEKDAETGKILSHCHNIASLGGSTLDNEENYLIKKLFSGGLGMIWIENQARV